MAKSTYWNWTTWLLNSEICRFSRNKTWSCSLKGAVFFEPGNRSDSGGRSYTKCHMLNWSYWTSLPWPKFISSPLKSYRNPNREAKSSSSPISFQGRTVTSSGRVLWQDGWVGVGLGDVSCVFLVVSLEGNQATPTGATRFSKGSPRNGYILHTTQLEKFTCWTYFLNTPSHTEV